MYKRQGEVSKVEGDNSGVQAGHLGERQIEKAVGYGNRRFHQARADRKLKPWRDVKQAEQAAVKANADFYWRKSVKMCIRDSHLQGRGGYHRG